MNGLRTPSIAVLMRLAVGLLAATAGCARPPEKPPSFSNLVLIVVDTLRSDHLPSYGGPRLTAPFLSRISDDGIQLQGVAVSSWTRTSIATLLTGLHPQHHGANTGSESLPEAAPYLPEILQKAGFATLGYASNDNSSHAYGFDRGFDNLVDVFPPGGAPDDLINPLSPLKPEGSLVTQVSLQLADQIDGRFLLYVHYLDPHDPYTPARSWNEEVQPDDYAQPADYPHPASSVSDDVLRRMVAQYDGAIAQVDRQIELLVAGLEERNLLRDTLVVVTSDHGEEFLEHGHLTHGKTLYEEALRVPLLLWSPDDALPRGYHSSQRFHHLDFMPTVLDALGLEQAAGVDGVSRWRSLIDASYREPSEMLHYLDLDGRAALARISGLRKTIHQGLLRPAYTRSIPTNLHFDLSTDPGETSPLVLDDSASSRSVSRVIAEHNRLARGRLTPSLASETDEMRRRLAALGYLAPAGLSLSLPARLRSWDGRHWSLFGHEDPTQFVDLVDFRERTEQLLYGWVPAGKAGGALSEVRSGLVFAARSDAKTLLIRGKARAGRGDYRILLRFNDLAGEPIEVGPGLFEVMRPVPAEALVGPLLYVDFEVERLAAKAARQPVVWHQVELN